MRQTMGLLNPDEVEAKMSKGIKNNVFKGRKPTSIDTDSDSFLFLEQSPKFEQSRK